MDPSRLKDRIARGLGTAARHIGGTCDAFRPASVDMPLDPANRYLKLPAAFTPDDSSFSHPVAYGHAAWSGIFDTAYTQPGDYLHGADGVFFIAAQQSLLPSLCILTTHTLTVSRALAPASPGVNGYGGITATTVTPMLTAWPASVLAAGGVTTGDLPGGNTDGVWNVLLPPTPVAIHPADLLTDEAGTSYVVRTAELTALGWRILTRQAVT
jgi:hypothetical protein